jgi:hypothetical protein
MTIRPITPPKADMRKPCPGAGRPGCNPACYHAKEHGYNVGACVIECPLTGVVCGGEK